MSDIVGQIRDCARDLGRDDEETKIFFWHCGILREAADLIVSLRKELVEARSEIARCHSRLEIDRAFTIGRDAEMLEFEVSMEDRANWPDAVECRDATISLLEGSLKSARERILEEAAREAETSPVNFEGRDIAAFIRALKDKQP